MHRHTHKERAEAISVILLDAPHLTGPEAIRFYDAVMRAARQLHRLYTKACNEPLTDRDERTTKWLEEDLRLRFKSARLGLYLNGDPRGNPVGILTPKSGKYNTMGGAEAGWRLWA